MKYFKLIWLIFFASTTYAQSYWESINEGLWDNQLLESRAFTDNQHRLVLNTPNGLYRSNVAYKGGNPVFTELYNQNHSIDHFLQTKKSNTLFITSSYSEANLYRSMDDGKTWTSLANGFPLNIVNLKDDLLLADVHVSSGNTELFYSKDLGNTWQSTHIKSNTYQLSYKQNTYYASDNSNGIYESQDGISWQYRKFPYTATHLFTNKLGYFVLVNDQHHSFVSKDFGRTWQDMGEAALALTGSNYVYIDQKGNLFCIYESGYLIRSEDDGLTWNVALTMDEDVSNILFFLDSGDRIFIQTQTATGVYNNTYQSSDSGRTWTPLNISISDYIRSVIPYSSDQYIVSTGNRVVYDVNIANGTWKTLNLNDTNPYLRYLNTSSLYENKQGQIFFFQSNFKSKRFRLDKYANKWTSFDIESPSVYRIALQNQVLWALGSEYRIWRSEDEGKNWHQKFELDHNNGYISTFAVSPKGEVVAASHDSLFHSKDEGTTWQSTPLPTEKDGDVRKIVYSPNATIFLNDSYRSTDGGKTFTRLFPDNSRYISRILGFNKGAIYASGSLDSTYNEPSFLISKDEGATWQQTSTNYGVLSDAQKCVFATNGDIYLLSNRLIFVSNDEGHSWQPMNSGLNADEVYDMILASDARIYLMAHNGVYRSVFKTDEPVPQKNALDAPYPNPTSQNTTLTFHLAEPSYLQIEVYNLLGQKITTLNDGFYGTGTFFVEWDTHDIAAGVYFIYLHTPAFSNTQKVVIQH